MPVVEVLCLLCAVAPYLQNLSMNSKNSFGGRELWRILIRIPTVDHTHGFLWMSIEYLQRYKCQYLSGLMLQGMTRVLLENYFVLTSDLNFLSCDFCS